MKKNDIDSEEIQKPVQLDEMIAEKVLLDPLLMSDPGNDMDLPEEFFENLHNKVMAEVETREILPAPRRWQKIPMRKWAKFSGVAATVICMTMGAALWGHSWSQSSSKSNMAQLSKSEQLLQEAIKSPDGFDSLVSAGIGQNDFFVDVASQNFDHLNLGDLNEFIASGAASPLGRN